MKIKILYIGNKLSIHGNTPTYIETFGSLLEKENYEVIYASSIKNIVFRLVDMIVKTIKNSNKVDYVLIDTYSTLNYWYAFIISQICRILNLPYVTILHGGNLPHRIKKNSRASDLIFNYAYKIVAPSLYLYNEFKAKYEAQLLYIPNSIEIKNYPFSRKKFEDPTILWVRSLASIYNPEMAIFATSLVMKKFPNTSLCMVGPDKENLKESLINLAKKLKVTIQIMGKMSVNEWTNLSKEYNVFINTTHFDNTPISVIEAMALGLPIVSTNVGGIPFLLKNDVNAQLVNDNDQLAMANAIINLFNSIEKTNIIVDNSRKLAEEYDWQVVKKQWFQILK